jgi:hypothetical protein
VDTIEGDAIRGGPGVAALSSVEPFDVVYSFGLFDYLPAAVLYRCAKRFLPFLKQEGRFVFCLKDARCYDAWFYDWLYDWQFVPRTFDDGLAIAARLDLTVVETMSVEGGAVVIFVCAKTG